jgi:hypothetical protein
MASKFKGILEHAKDREPAAVADEPPPPSPAPPVAPTRKPGRPATGKRSDADYVQTTAYIHKDTHREVKIALLKSGDDQDFSELVDSLLIQWLKSRS